MEELQLHDIKGLVEIPDDSIYYFYGLITLGLILCILAAVLIYRYVNREKNIDLQKIYKQELSELDLTQTKESAYKLTHFGHLLEKDGNQTAAFELLTQELNAFKYKKDVPEFDEELRSQISRFLDLMNVQ